MPLVDFSSLRVLVVEDSLHMRRILRTMLSGLGVRDVQEAEDGAEALERLKGLNPDIVVLDWVMPILDGIEFTRLARTGGGSNPPRSHHNAVLAFRAPEGADGARCRR